MCKGEPDCRKPCPECKREHTTDNPSAVTTAQRHSKKLKIKNTLMLNHLNFSISHVNEKSMKKMIEKTTFSAP